MALTSLEYLFIQMDTADNGIQLLNFIDAYLENVNS